MRLWMVPPKLLCRKHLLGEHVECHMFIGTIYRRISVDGYIARGLLDPSALWARHDELVRELERRGFAHRSPLPTWGLSVQAVTEVLSRRCPIDARASLRELCERCNDCARRTKEVAKGNDPDQAPETSRSLRKAVPLA
jgi:hypothetical protein